MSGFLQPSLKHEDDLLEGRRISRTFRSRAHFDVNSIGVSIPVITIKDEDDDVTMNTPPTQPALLRIMSTITLADVPSPGVPMPPPLASSSRIEVTSLDKKTDDVMSQQETPPTQAPPKVDTSNKTQSVVRSSDRLAAVNVPRLTRRTVKLQTPIVKPTTAKKYTKQGSSNYKAVLKLAKAVSPIPKKISTLIKKDICEVCNSSNKDMYKLSSVWLCRGCLLSIKRWQTKKSNPAPFKDCDLDCDLDRSGDSSRPVCPACRIEKFKQLSAKGATGTGGTALPTTRKSTSTVTSSSGYSGALPSLSSVARSVHSLLDSTLHSLPPASQRPFLDDMKKILLGRMAQRS